MLAASSVDACGCRQVRNHLGLLLCCYRWLLLLLLLLSGSRSLWHAGDNSTPPHHQLTILHFPFGVCLQFEICESNCFN